VFNDSYIFNIYKKTWKKQ
jgi:hypothetical protein